MEKILFIFRRGLRIHDNTGLMAALEDSKTVIPVFIFDPNQIGKNPYKSNNSIQFMVESLEDLDKSLRKRGSKLWYFHGNPEKVVKKLLKDDEAIDAVYVNMDYTPYSISRDKKLAKVCKKMDVEFKQFEDYLLMPVNKIKTKSGTPYKVFTAFYNAGKRLSVRKSKKNNYKGGYLSGKTKLVGQINNTKIKQFYKENDEVVVRGGRKECLRILKSVVPSIAKKYNKDRNTPSIDTTRLSAYNKFGCCSIREVYEAFVKATNKGSMIVRQLWWRDFYTYVMYHFPYSASGAFQEKFDRIKWKHNSSWLQKWKTGMTGFPIVDAGMRQMNETGWMHNRVRMIVASFLAKDLLINWHHGERYFSQQLVDIDWSVNNGNWGTVVGVGASSLAWFRVFNPWDQLKKYDPECEYVKEWIPELKDVLAKDILKWYETYDLYDVDYPKPMLDHQEQKEKALKMYKRAA